MPPLEFESSQRPAPLVSVITATKNRLPLLLETIESVRQQEYSQWEHIIVDDGSDDGTVQHVESLVAQDMRLRFVRRSRQPSGANACRNIGLADARGTYVVFLDSDDLLRPACLGRRVDVMVNNRDLDFAVFRAKHFTSKIDDDDRLYHDIKPGDDLLRFLSHECIWEISGPIWRRQFVQQIGGFDERLLSLQDLELHIRALAALPKYVVFEEVDHDIRGHSDDTRTSTRHFRDLSLIRNRQVFQQKVLLLLHESYLLTWSRRRSMLGFSFASSELLSASGSLVESLKIWVRDCRHLRAPILMILEGVVLLLGVSIGVGGRVVGKWKGWRRLRPEPVPANLMK